MMKESSTAGDMVVFSPKVRIPIANLDESREDVNGKITADKLCIVLY